MDNVGGRIGLGTVQFGCDYGLTNNAGQIAEADAARILNRAAELGVRVLDTAPAYGDSEAVLGRAIVAKDNFHIITKTPNFSGAKIDSSDVKALRRSLEVSEKHLGTKGLHTLLVHHGSDVVKPGGNLIIDCLQELKASGAIQEIGVSVYSADEIDVILDTFTPDVIQLPVSIVDQRLIKSGHLSKLKHAGVKIHARSIFLQGALLVEPEELPEFLEPVKELLIRARALPSTKGLSFLEICLGFVLSRHEIDSLIVGVTSIADLEKIMAAADNAKNLTIDWELFSLDNPTILNLALWPKQG